MKYWVLYFLALVIAVSVLPIVAQNSVAGEAVPTVTVYKDGAVTEMTVDEYVLCVLIAQSDFVESRESRKALAVSARSCAMYFALYGCKHDDYNACADGNCCIALGCEGDTDAETIAELTEMIDETKGEILTLDSMPALSLFTLCASKGTRQCEEYPYLTPVAEPARCEIHKTELVNETENELVSLLGNTEADPPYLVYDDNEKCVLAILGGKIIEAEEIAEALSLPTVEFTLTIEESKLISVCYGVGHGYGLNLCGAEGLAEKGYSYEKILEIYYPKLKINKIYTP